jgi:hypothetical protein
MSAMPPTAGQVGALVPASAGQTGSGAPTGPERRHAREEEAAWRRAVLREECGSQLGRETLTVMFLSARRCCCFGENITTYTKLTRNFGVARPRSIAFRVELVERPPNLVGAFAVARSVAINSSMPSYRHWHFSPLSR